MKCRQLLSSLLAACALGAAFAGPVSAQVPTPLGATPATASGNLSYLAYDDKHDVYLYVHEILPNRHVLGRFIGANGTPLGSEFVVSVNAVSFAVRPKVTYSRGNVGTDVFLVTYSADQAKPGSANIFGQLVRYTGTGPTGGALIGATIPISPNSMSTAPRVSQLTGDAAFNPITGRFLVAWEDYPAGPSDVQARLFNADGAPAGGAVPLAVGPGSQGAPALAFDWARNKFMAVFSGSNPSAPDPEAPSAWGVFGYLLDGTTAAPASALAVLQGGNNIEAAVTYLPERDGFLAAWTGVTGGPRTSNARFMGSTDTAASLPSPWFVMQASGNSVGAPRLDYDPVSRRVLAASMLAQDPAVGVVGGTVLDAGGTPVTGLFRLSNVPAAISGTYYPTVRRGESGIVGVSYVNDYATAQFERFQLPASQTPGPDYNCAVNCTQLPTDTDGDGVPDSTDACPTVFAQTANGCPTPAVATNADFTGDSRPELIWQNVGAAGQVYEWFLTSSLTLTGGTFLVNDGTIPAGWSVVGTSDMTGDGKPDILWQNQQTGQVMLFIMNGSTKVIEQPIATNAVWRIVGTGDLNGDNKADIVWQNFTTGQVYVWFMSPSNGVAATFNPFQGGFVQDAQLNPTVLADKTWRVVGIGDVNNDGKADLIWQHPSGTLSAWLLQGLVVGSTVDVPFADTTWKVRAVGDYNGDGHPDLIFQKTDTGDIAAWLLNGAALLQGVPMGRVSLTWKIAGAK